MGFVEAAQHKVATDLALPQGYRLATGVASSRTTERAAARSCCRRYPLQLGSSSFCFLTTFGSIRHVVIPFALIGGALALVLTGGVLFRSRLGRIHRAAPAITALNGVVSPTSIDCAPAASLRIALWWRARVPRSRSCTRPSSASATTMRPSARSRARASRFSNAAIILHSFHDFLGPEHDRVAGLDVARMDQRLTVNESRPSARSTASRRCC